jgi:membrane protein YqaA with SNARE-associated domain
MKPAKLPGWLSRVVATLGGGGLFVVAFFDSSVLSFPLVLDLLIIQLAAQKPTHMPYYAAMATLGSLAGCLWLYWMAKKGGEAFFHKRAGVHAHKIRDWIGRYTFLSIFLAAILPPPMPFKAFILAAGVFEAPLQTFVLALLAGRALRYFGEGILAVRYGDAVGTYLLAHKLAGSLIVLGVSVAGYLVGHWLLRRPVRPA